jgi:hypothetical protein
MAIDHQELYAPRDAIVVEPSFARRLVRDLAPQDWLVVSYQTILVLIAMRVPPSHAQQISVERMGALWLFLVATLLVVRGGVLRHGFWAPLLYRFAIYGTVQLSYFFLATLLPLVNVTTLDVGLYKLDLALFGFEPALAMDRFVTPATTEWFAFYYFGYFFLLAIHVIPILLFTKNVRVVSEFALGMITVFCVGHLVYMLVPGYGPHKALASEFANSLPHGMWRDMVMATVASGGAQLDIFPSLHTAAPTFITLFSYRNRDKVPFRYSWPLTGFFALNIMIATMFLRWHYVIDVVAGLTLALVSFWVGVRFTQKEGLRREAIRREGHAMSESWPRFLRDPS